MRNLHDPARRAGTCLNSMERIIVNGIVNTVLGPVPADWKLKDALLGKQ